MGIRITDDHRYYNDTGVEYQGITSLIGKYKQPFDSKAVATRYAKVHGGTPEFWMRKWDEGRDTACDRGHLFHEFKEQGSLDRGVEIMGGAARMVRNQRMYLQKSPSLYTLPDGFYAELMMWDDGYRLAGTADKVNIETVNGIRYVDMDDYKTNKRIETESHQFRDGSFKMMQPPVKHLMDCNYYHYELQLSFYMFVLERHGFTFRSMMITHYPPAADERKVRDVLKRNEYPPKPYVMEYRKREVLAILNHNLKHRSK